MAAGQGRAGAAAPGPVPVVAISLWALASGTVVSVGVGALAPELRADLGFSRTEIGVLTALVSVGAAIASRRAGRLTDALGPVRVLFASLLLMAAATLVGAVAPAGPVLMGAMLVIGLAYGGVNPPTNVVVAGQMSRRLGFYMSVKQTGVPVGGFLAGIVLPPIAVAVSWRLAFGLTSIVAVSVALASALWLRGARTLRGEARADGAGGITRLELTSITAFGFLMAGLQWVFLAYLVLYLTERQDWSLETAGLALSVGTACSAGGRVFWGWLSDRPGRRIPVLVATAVVSTGTLAAIALGASGPAIWPLAGATGAALVGWNGVFHALLADRAGPGALGKVSGDVMAVVFVGGTSLPPLFGLISEQVDSWTLLWALAAGSAAVAAAVLHVGLRVADARARAR
ncbi:MAG: MFS transporter [Thermoleophilia bacterium]